MLTDSRALAVRERGADRDRRVHAGDDVGDRHSRALRLIVGLAGDAHHAAHTLDHEVVARALPIRAGLAEARDRAVDEPRIHFAHLTVAQPVAREVAVLVV